MLSKQLDERTWLTSDEEGDTTYLVTTSYSRYMLRVNIGIIDSDVIDLSTVSVEREVWCGEIYTVCPDTVAKEILLSFLGCRNPKHPIELVYSWGGQLGHRNIETPG